MAAAVDRLSLLLWFKTDDGRQGINRPPSIIGTIIGDNQDDNPVETFETAEEYEAAWTQITGVAHGR